MSQEPTEPFYDEQLEIQMALEESGSPIPPYPTTQAGLDAMRERLSYLKRQQSATTTAPAHSTEITKRLTRTLEYIAFFERQLKARN